MSPGLLAGARFVPRGLRLLRIHSELWPLCALPLALNLVLFTVAAWVFLAHLDQITAGLGAFLTFAEAEAWYEWIWLGPLVLLAWMIRWLLILAFGFLVYLLFTLVGSVVAAPFLDLLSRRVEQLRTGEIIASEGGVWSDAIRALVSEGRRVAFFLTVQALILVLGLVPGMAPVAAVLAFVFAALFLPLDYCGHLLDRRGVSFSERRVWLWQNRQSFFGFGATATGTYLVPGLNFICLPLLVASGTLLALELGPPRGPSPDVGQEPD